MAARSFKDNSIVLIKAAALVLSSVNYALQPCAHDLVLDNKYCIRKFGYNKNLNFRAQISTRKGYQIISNSIIFDTVP